MKRIPRRIFQEEFKREAIRLVNEQGLTISTRVRRKGRAPISEAHCAGCVFKQAKFGAMRFAY
jgi:hypothetical protein